MNILTEINYKFLFFGDLLNDKHDFYVYSNFKGKNCDYLFFFDSRGISKEFSGSISENCFKYQSKLGNIIIVVRPLEITTWVTLYNFLTLNSIVPKNIITNMGFVDFTPKKKVVLKKYLDQFKLYFKALKVNFTAVDYFLLSSGEKDYLYTMAYPELFTKSLESKLKYCNTIILNTPSIDINYHFERNRPKSFFEAINQGNDYNMKLDISKKIINFPVFTNHETYDGVHYTKAGNSIVFNKLISFLIANAS